MRLLHLSLWGAGDPLIRNSVYPKLKILREEFSLTDLHLCIFNRWEAYDGELDHLLPGLRIHVLESNSSPVGVLDLPYRVFQWKKKFRKLLAELKPDRVIMHGTPIGVLSFSECVRAGIPYQVESCEPHAQYMADSGAWSRSGFKYLYARIQEKSLFSNAKFLLPVSPLFGQYLMANGIDTSRIVFLPCCISTHHFAFDEEKRNLIRNSFRIPNQSITGIYVGKFEGVYFPFSVLGVLGEAFSGIDSYHHIFLTAESPEAIRRVLGEHDIPLERIFIVKSPPDKVSDYLSAADFAWSFIKPSSSSPFCSPVKNAEYLASGLPVLIPTSIGEDSDLILSENAGVQDNFVEGKLQEGTLNDLKAILMEDGHRQRIAKISYQKRGLHLIGEAYKIIYK